MKHPVTLRSHEGPDPGWDGVHHAQEMGGGDLHLHSGGYNPGDTYLSGESDFQYEGCHGARLQGCPSYHGPGDRHPLWWHMAESVWLSEAALQNRDEIILCVFKQKGLASFYMALAFFFLNNTVQTVRMT